MQIGMSASGANGLRSVANAIRRMPEASGRAATQAANDVARSVRLDSSRDLAQRYNLPASYIREQFSVADAQGSHGVAIVKVRHRAVRLARFGANQLTKTAKRAKGDPSRRIAAGRKQAGVSVKVLRSGGRKQIKTGFFMPLRAGNVDGGNGFGLFVREGDKLVHKYGPAPHQVFNAWAEDRRPNLQQALVKAFRARLAAEIRRSAK